MRIHVHEHITSGALADTVLPPSLATEGGAMLHALGADLGQLEGTQVATTVDTRLETPTLENVTVERIATGANGRAAFDRLARECDATIIIAPETGGTLLALTRRALELGARVLGSSPQAVELCGDKLALTRHLEATGIPYVPATLSTPPHSLPWPPPWVVKPRFGAGCENTFVAEDERELPPPDRNSDADPIVTPLLPGLPASVLLVAGERATIALEPCAQRLSENGRLAYLGGHAPLEPTLARRARTLALAAATTVPELRGFAGVDVLLGACGDRVVEINPRLTTSYVGLRALAGENLAALALELLDGAPARSPRWQDGSVSFEPTGEVTVREVTYAG